MTLGVFMNLEKAFDMVWKEEIIEQLSKMDVKGKPLEWIYKFLQDRSIQVRVGSALSEPLVVENGTPQGSVLSPLLFIIMMNAIPNHCKRVELSMYADDIALWTTGTSLRAMTTRMQKKLNKTAKFLSANGFKISAPKSQAVLFTNSRVKRSEANIRLRIGKEQIPLSSTATFSGIVLDARLSWSAHAEADKARCMKRLNAMRSISGSWGASKSNLLQVYRATILSGLDYGCEVIDLVCLRRHIRQASVSSSEDLLWRHEGNECFVPASGMRWASSETYVIRSSCKTMPSGLSTLKMNLLKLNISFHMAGSPSLRLGSIKMKKRGETTHTGKSSPSSRQTS